MMIKKYNRVALALWIAAVLLAFSNSIEIWIDYNTMSPLNKQAGEGYLVWSSLIRSATNVIAQFAILGGLATLIEIADRILTQVRKSN